MRSFYLEQRIWLHRVPAWVKLGVLSGAGTILFVSDDTALTLATAAATAALYASLGTAAWRLLPTLRGCALVLALVLLFHVFTDSWRIGLAAALRLGSLTMLGLLLTLSTRFDELLALAETILSPSRVLGLRTDRLALAFGLMLRFIEIFFLKWRQMDEACRARSGKAGGMRLLAPLALQVFASAERVGEALSARLGW